MPDDPNRPPQGDRFGWGQQPLHRTDETTGDEGIEPPVGQGHDEATTGRPAEPPRAGNRDDTPQAPDSPIKTRRPDAQES
ncbi:hypothetical protein [Tautonia rosea]|uniref:hypothetical protein n=1 Tax=Tautonia rosea TaxID=2728037 RepID=UPI001474ABB4|nr:hypothetical protein [Tautonia rosea]